MRLTSLSPAVKSIELELDYYHGKDIVHEGNLLHLDPEIAWKKISKTTRHNINKAKLLSNLVIKKVKGTKKDTQAFRKIWFDPNNPTLPDVLDKDELMYMAYLDNELVAGMILSPMRSNLYLHFMAGTTKAKEKNINSYIIWHAINELKDSKYKFIDIGVSFRKSLYTFFNHWQTEKYPIIFEPPYILPQIRLIPFVNEDVLGFKNHVKKDTKPINENFSDNYTILPRGTYAIKAILQYLNLTKKDNVAVFNTFDTTYISRCVSEPILSITNLTRKIDNKTKAVLVIHEFGYPYKELVKLKEICTKKNIPLIEDCAWSMRTKIDTSHTIGDIGDFAIFSLPKIFPMQYGAVLKGVTFTDEETWQKYMMLDFYKREIVLEQLINYLPKLDEFNNARRNNLSYLQKLFENDGYILFKKLESDEFPAAILVQLTTEQEMHDLASRYLEFGIEAGKYYPKNVLYLPIHQNLDINQLDYIYAVFRGYLNLCKDYRRK